jgi:hypothetical protein
MEPDMRISVDANPRYIVVTDCAGFLASAIALLLLSLVPSLFSALAIGLLISALAAGFGLDVALWFARGSVELSEDSLALYQGLARASRIIGRSRIAGLRVRTTLGRRAIVIRLMPRGVVRIAEDAFPREAFSRLVSALSAWR